MLQELGAATVAFARVAASLCAGADWSEIFQSLGVTFEPCGCYLRVLMRWSELKTLSATGVCGMRRARVSQTANACPRKATADDHLGVVSAALDPV